MGKDIKTKVTVDKERGLPDEDTTTFSLWLKSELEPNVAKVSISQRLRGNPCIVVGEVSSSMRAIMSMMDQ